MNKLDAWNGNQNENRSQQVFHPTATGGMSPDRIRIENFLILVRCENLDQDLIDRFKSSRNVGFLRCLSCNRPRGGRLRWHGRSPVVEFRHRGAPRLGISRGSCSRTFRLILIH